MDRRLKTVVLALATGIPAAANAQTRFIAPAIPGASMPVAPIVGPALNVNPALSPARGLASPQMTLLPTPLVLTPATSLSAPNAVAAPLAAAAAAGMGGLATAAKAHKPGQAVAARGSLESLAASIAPKNGEASPAAADNLRKFFDAGAFANAMPESMQFSAGYLDPRVSNALQALSRTAVGLSVYRQVYSKYGATLELRVDGTYGADYDARLTWEGDKPVIQVTDALVRRESPEFAGSFLAREMSHLYYDAFPASVERDYLANSVLVRSYAEMTGSGNQWWDKRHDRWQNGRYAMQSYYQSWREAVVDYYGRNRPIQESPFFRYLQGNGGQTLEQQYYNGTINSKTYREMRDYFQQMAQSEYDWLRPSDR